ncbi:unnamed protein product, partial [Ectocarpus sp. 13 AM-2016]
MSPPQHPTCSGSPINRRTGMAKQSQTSDSEDTAEVIGAAGGEGGRGEGKPKGTGSPPRFPIRNGCARPVEQEVLQREWEKLGVEEKAIRRAQRARRGERCSQCGCVGYFRRNCPTCPPVRFDVRADRWRSPTAEEKAKEKAREKERQMARTITTKASLATAIGSGPGANAKATTGNR